MSELFDRHDIDISKLTTELPRSVELPFDPDRDIAPALWQGLHDSLPQFRERELWSSLGAVISRVKILSPRQFQRLDLGDEDWQHIRREILSAEYPKNDPTYFSTLNYHVLFPDLERPSLSTHQWQPIKRSLLNERENPDWFFLRLGALTVVSPKRAAEFQVDRNNLWQNSLNLLAAYKEDSRFDDFIDLAAGMRLSRATEAPPLNLDEIPWQSLASHVAARALEMESSGSRDFDDSLNLWTAMAQKLRLLEAPYIQLTPNGLILEKPVSGDAPANTLPEQRQY